MPRGIAEKPPGESEFAARLGRQAGNARDPLRLAGHGEGMRVEKEVDVWFGADNRLFLGIFKLLERAGALLRVIAELLDDVADPRIPAALNQALRPDTDLARAVAAEHAAILHEGHLQSHPGGRERRSQPRVATTDHDQVVGPLRFGFRGKPEGLATPGGEYRGVVGRRCRIGGQQDAVAAAVEAGEVVQGEPRLAGGQFDGAAVVPCPRRALRAEGLGEWRTVDEHLKTPRRAGGVPAGHPVFRPHEHAVGPGRGDRDARRRIGNGLPEAVGHQIGRAHLADKLGIQAPAAMVGEALGLDEHRGGRCRTGRHQQPDQDKKRGP